MIFIIYFLTSLNKKSSGVAAAAVLYDGNQGTEYGVKMHDMASVFSAELQAIELGLKNIPDPVQRYFENCTYSYNSK